MEMIEAIVLRSLDYKDSSKILYLYTDKGLISVIAHGVKKMNSQFRVLSQAGNLIRLSISQSKFPSLKDGMLVNDFENLRKDIVAFTYLSHILELINNTVPEDSDHVKMFLFLKKLLQKMDMGMDPETVSFIFELKLLYFLGYGLNFKQCNVCAATDDLVFSVEHGGLVCRAHLLARQSSYDKDIYQVLMYLYMIDLDNAEVPNLDKNLKVIIRHIIDMLLSDYLGFKTKSRSIIEQLQKY